jgi:glycosyltransferase involved in cell wall biosynthesis
MGRPLDRAQREEAEAVPDIRIHQSDFALEWEDDPWEEVDEAAQWLLDIARTVRPDVVHVNGYAHAALPWTAPVVCAAHSCVLSWWRAVKREPAPPRYDEYRNRVAAGLNAADVVIAPSHAMLECLTREYGFSGTGVAIANGRTASLFHSAQKDQFVLTSGRVWDEGKNIEALCTVSESVSWPVCVAGDSMHPDGSVRPTPGVRTLGRLSTTELSTWFARAPIYALPARYEPFGLSAVEAALSGCALVLGDIPSLREVWGDAALYVFPEDHSELAGSIERVIRSSTLREDLAGRARLRARRFAPERMAAATLAAYRLAQDRFTARQPAAA